MTEIFNTENIVALLTLTFLEIVLGIDNLIFISILVSKVEKAKQGVARTLGLTMALGTRILLLLSISWVMRLTNPLFSILEQPFSGRDIILIVGGLFLIGKSTHEIHDKMEPEEQKEKQSKKKKSSFVSIIIQIALLDIIFSLDSVITAIGMVNNLPIMITAIIISMIVMLLSAKSISEFIDKHPTLKILALSFLLLIGVMLIADGFGQHISKGYIYFAIGFSLFVETLNLKMRAKE
jgi:predicted tellurium resistance membrane protein TerC